MAIRYPPCLAEPLSFLQAFLCDAADAVGFDCEQKNFQYENAGRIWGHQPGQGEPHEKVRRFPKGGQANKQALSLVRLLQSTAFWPRGNHPLFVKSIL